MIYYIACTETLLVKIGYTANDPEKRLKALQTGSAGELTLIAVEPGSQADERDLHAQFADDCVRGEWFKMSEALFERLGTITWLTAKHFANTGKPQPEWVITGLKTLHENVAPLPPDLAAILLEHEPA